MLLHDLHGRETAWAIVCAFGTRKRARPNGSGRRSVAAWISIPEPGCANYLRASELCGSQRAAEGQRSHSVLPILGSVSPMVETAMRGVAGRTLLALLRQQLQ